VNLGARAWLLALADDELITGHRHSEWLGIAPFLEEDLAYASIAQDELGHARALFGLLTDDIDGLAFGRPASDFRSAWIVELPCPMWEDALARHFLYDLAETVRWQALLTSTVPGLRDLAVKALREEEYHLRHAGPLVRRMLMGTDESRSRMVGALRRLYPLGRSIFEQTEHEDDAISSGAVGLPAASLEEIWRGALAEELAASGVALDWDATPTGTGGRRGVRSEHFGDLLETMTAVLSLDPAATW
jgi:ring-1,2-phenylacetyl-CoA epoxidase subunit PaaC